MLLGLGYLPRHTGPALWRNFDPAEIRDDLAHIAALGFQAVRVPLFWADFQPSLDRVEPRSLDHFGQFLQLAHDHGLSVKAGLWAGMWDGVLWWPEWGVTPAPLPPHWPLMVHDRRMRWGRVRHPFTDTQMLAARRLLLTHGFSYFKDHPALLAWEPLPGFGRMAAGVDRAAVLDWVGSAIEMLNDATPGRAITFLLAMDALETRPGIWPRDILTAGGTPSLSVATFASDRRRLPLNARWIAFVLDLAAALSGQPIAMNLAGLPTSGPGQPAMAADGVYYASEEEAAHHLADVIALAHDRQCPQLWLWRWADIPEPQWQNPPYDQAPWRRHTGLLRQDGSEKGVVEGLRQASTSATAWPRLEVDPEAYAADPVVQFVALWSNYQRATGQREEKR